MLPTIDPPPPKPERGINYSRIASWLKCRELDRLVSEEKLVPRIEPGVMVLGSVGHAVMASLIRNSGNREAAAGIAEWCLKGLNAADLPEEQNALNEQTCNTAVEIAYRAYAFLQPERWETVVLNGEPLCEQQLRCKIPGWDYFHGTSDWVAREVDTGAVWLIDHKFRKQFLPPWSEELNLQMVAYTHLLLKHGIKPVGSRQFQIRSRLPSVPKLNKDGSVSRVRIATTWEAYKDAVVKAGRNPADYAEMEGKLDFQFFDLDSTRTYRTEEEVERTWKTTIVAAARDIARKGRAIYRTASHMSCGMCRFKELCVEDMKGGDTAFIRSVRFKNVDDTSRLKFSDFVMEEEDTDGNATNASLD